MDIIYQESAQLVDGFNFFIPGIGEQNIKFCCYRVMYR